MRNQRHVLALVGIVGRSTRPAVLSSTALALVFAGLSMAQPTIAVSGTAFEYNGDVRNLPPVLTTAGVKPRIQRFNPPPRINPGQVVQPPINIPRAPMPSPTQNFAGLSFTDFVTGGQGGAGIPPDPNGDVGRNHYIEAVNDAYAIYSKTGVLLAAFTEDSLFGGTGSNPCNGNSQGDPVVLYDQQADRWILTHFASAVDSSGNGIPPFYECIAASKSGDPVAGGWWLWPLRMDPGTPPQGTFNDYPKFGIWSDRCLYMSANGFSVAGNFVGVVFASFPLNVLEAGGSINFGLGFINDPNDPFTMIPSNLLGSSLPAPGTPNYFVSESQSSFAFEVRKFTPGPSCGGGGILSAPINVSQSGYTVPNGDDVPQPGTNGLLDDLRDRLMQKVQYRRVGSAESLWVVHSVRTSSSSPVAPQWAQIDVSGGNVATTPVQQQIFVPDTALNRWMGSIAADKMGNAALGYSTSSATAPNFPSIAYAGRLVTDPLGNLSQTETQLIAGSGSQTVHCGSSTVPCNRWGDYTAMSVDPVDDCTFWYVNQYYSSQSNGNTGNWQTRIGSFKFASCGGTPPPLTITGPASLPQGNVNVPYPATTITATGGTGPYTWSWFPTPPPGANQLPPGLSIGPNTGVISGTPSDNVNSPYFVTVKVTDAASATATKTYSIQILNQPLVITGPPSLPAGTVNQPYPQIPFGASGGVGPYSWSATGLPPQLQIVGNEISGTPTTNVGSPFTVIVTVKDSLGIGASKTYSLTINPVNGGVVLNLGNGAAAPGQSVEVPIQLTTLTGTLPAGFQADASFDQSKLSYVSSRIGEQLTNAGKTLSAQVQPNNDVRFLGIGFNQNTIANGNVVYVTFKLSNQFTAGGTTNVALNNCQCTDANSVLLTTSCTAGTITAGCSCDANGDGSINVADVQFVINQVLNGNASVCHSGGVNVADVQRVINAVLGLGCK